ncbi:SH3 domain-containing protein [Clostridium sp.]
MVNRFKIVGKVIISTLILGTIITGKNVVQAKDVSTNSTTINTVASLYNESQVNVISDEFANLGLEKCDSPNGAFSAYYNNGTYDSIYVKNNENNEEIRIEPSGICSRVFWINDRYLLANIQCIGLVLYDMDNLDMPKSLYEISSYYFEVPVKVTAVSNDAIQFTDEWGTEQETRYKFMDEVFTIDNSPKKIKEISYDLNSDNIPENISVYYDKTGTGICTVKVNDSSKSISLESNLGQSDLIINVIDINKNDKIKEIQFIETIENDYQHIVFFKFDGKSLLKIIELKPDKFITSMSFDGKGNIKASYVNQSLYTLGCIDNYKYDGKSIKLIPSKYYKLNTPTTVIFPIKVQKSQTNKAAPFKLYKGEKVTIVTTDGKGWFKLLNSKKKEGWFYFDKKTYKLQGKQQWQVFKNLPIAG